MRRALRGLAWLAWGWGLPLLSFAAPTDPDTAWGSNGMAVLPEDATQLRGMLVTPDGGTLVSFQSSTPRIIRLNASGQLDGSFAGTGAITPPAFPYVDFGGIFSRFPAIRSTWPIVAGGTRAARSYVPVASSTSLKRGSTT